MSSRRSSGERGWGSHPASRYATTAGRAARNTSARSSSVSPHWNCVEVAGWGRFRSRIHEGSPVMCTSEHSSAGALEVLEHRRDHGVVVGERHPGVRISGPVHGRGP